MQTRQWLERGSSPRARSCPLTRRALRGEVKEAGFAVEALVGIEGPAWAVPDLDAWLEVPRRRVKLLAAIGRVEAEPSPIGASAHLLVVGRRP